MIEHTFYSQEGRNLARMLPEMHFFAQQPEVKAVPFECITLCEPDDRFGFLHEAAIIAYKGVLYASWYHCPTLELEGYTPICGKRSFDGGKTWSALEILMDDPAAKIMYCPPVYGICDDHLYMLVNQMVAPDHMHSLDLYMLNEENGKFERLWSRPIPFKLNTNVVRLPNGKLMLPGRMGDLDQFPNTPAVMISDSGKIDAEWRMVKIAENGDLPDGSKLVFPEITAIVEGNRVFMFCRNDERLVPLVYISEDLGETWSPVHSHDVPYIASKIYTGTLSNGRNYLIANIDKMDRSRLAMYLTAPDEMKFAQYTLLFDHEKEENFSLKACHYPCAWEENGKLYIVATINYEWSRRGAVLFVIDLDNL